MLPLTGSWTSLPTVANGEHAHDVSFSDYWHEKLRKVRLQWRKDMLELHRVRHGGLRRPLLFKGLRIWVDGFTNPSAEEIQLLVYAHGGEMEYTIGSRVNMVVATHFPYNKVVQFQSVRKSPVPVVRPGYIVDCVRQGKRLSPNGYILPVFRRVLPTGRHTGASGVSSIITEYWQQEKPGSSPMLLSPPDQTVMPDTTDSVVEVAQASALSQANTPAPLTSSMAHPSTCSQTTEPEPAPSATSHSDLEIVPSPSPVLLSPTARLTAIRMSTPQVPLECRVPSHATECVCCPPTDPPTPRDTQFYLRLHHNVKACSCVDPDFVRGFFSRSRLHFLGSFKDYVRQWTPELLAITPRFPLSAYPRHIRRQHQAHVNSGGAGGSRMAAGDWGTLGSFFARRSVTRHGEDARSDAVGASDPEDSPDAHLLYLHVDMDCFFASVITVKEPSLRGRPVVVAHNGEEQTTGQDTPDTRKINPRRVIPRGQSRATVIARNTESKSTNTTNTNTANNTSTQRIDSSAIPYTASISSANYAARALGIHAEMSVGTAYGICPNLTVRNYDFPAFRAASRAFLEACFAVTHRVEVVSCDEVYMEVCVGQEEQGHCPPDQVETLAQELRADIARRTGGCHASVGIGRSVLLARLACRKAKPDGIAVMSGDQKELDALPVRALPQVGYRTARALDNLGVKLCGQLRAYALNKLQEEFGDATGRLLYHSCRGSHVRALIPLPLPLKSGLTTKVGWGVRLHTHAHWHSLTRQMAAEVQSRLARLRCAASKVTVSVMCRRPDAPRVNTYKLLGHGRCVTHRSPLLHPPFLIHGVQQDADQVTRASAHRSFCYLVRALQDMVCGKVQMDLCDVRGVGVELKALRHFDAVKARTMDTSQLLLQTTVSPHRHILPSAHPHTKPSSNIHGTDTQPSTAGGGREEASGVGLKRPRPLQPPSDATSATVPSSNSTRTHASQNPSSKRIAHTLPSSKRRILAWSRTLIRKTPPPADDGPISLTQFESTARDVQPLSRARHTLSRSVARETPINAHASTRTRTSHRASHVHDWRGHGSAPPEHKSAPRQHTVGSSVHDWRLDELPRPSQVDESFVAALPAEERRELLVNYQRRYGHQVRIPGIHKALAQPDTTVRVGEDTRNDGARGKSTTLAATSDDLQTSPGLRGQSLAADPADPHPVMPKHLRRCMPVALDTEAFAAFISERTIAWSQAPPHGLHSAWRSVILSRVSKKLRGCAGGAGAGDSGGGSGGCAGSFVVFDAWCRHLHAVQSIQRMLAVRREQCDAVHPGWASLCVHVDKWSRQIGRDVQQLIA